MKIQGLWAVVVVLTMTLGPNAQTRDVREASGRVTAVAVDSLTIQAKTEAITIAVDDNTRVTGKGVGTITRSLKAEGRPPRVGDLVQQYDSVRVKFSETGGRRLATEIRIVVKGFKAP